MPLPRLALIFVCLAACLGAPAAAQQVEPAISEAQLREPWVKQLAALEAAAGSIRSVKEAKARSTLADALATLEVSLGEYERQVDDVIDRLAADKQFVFAAAETSQTLGAQVADIRSRFQAVYAAVGALDREDVRAAQAALLELEQVLAAKRKFDRDVENASASGSRQPLVALATRWWNGEEQVIAVKKLAGQLRAELDRLPASDR